MSLTARSCAFFTLLRLLFCLYLVAPISATGAPSHQEATVVDVVDGDTIVVSIGATREHVRLIGIDTPESRPNRRAELQSRNTSQDQKTILALGHQAFEHTRKLLPNNLAIRLEFDLDRRDRYERLLAYVWLPNGSMANEEIVRSGYAYLLTIPPNVKYRERFAQAFSEARSKKRGLWASSALPPEQSGK